MYGSKLGMLAQMAMASQMPESMGSAMGGETKNERSVRDWNSARVEDEYRRVMGKVSKLSKSQRDAVVYEARRRGLDKLDTDTQP